MSLQGGERGVTRRATPRSRGFGVAGRSPGYVRGGRSYGARRRRTTCGARRFVRRPGRGAVPVTPRSGGEGRAAVRPYRHLVDRGVRVGRGNRDDDPIGSDLDDDPLQPLGAPGRGEVDRVRGAAEGLVLALAQWGDRDGHLDGFTPLAHWSTMVSLDPTRIRAHR